MALRTAGNLQTASLWRALKRLRPLVVAVCAMPAFGQAAPPAPTAATPAQTEQLSPGAAYQEAVRPVEITRRSVANWSAVEVQALTVAIRQGATACAARSFKTFSGDDLADFIRLCALGQAWPTVIQAAGRYLADRSNITRLGEVYGEMVAGDLHLKDEPAALHDAQAMLANAPYSPEVVEASDGALNYMEVLYTPDAVALASLRQRLVLQALQQTPPNPAPSIAASPPQIPLADLYRQGLRLAALQQLNRKPADAAQTVQALNDAVGSKQTSDDQLRIASMQHVYAQLGQPLGLVTPRPWLDVPAHAPAIPAHRAVTVLLIFPDWCAQCVHLARQLPPTVFTVERHEAYAFGLLVQTVPPQPPEKQPAGKPAAAPAQPGAETYDAALAATYLRGTPSGVVDPAWLARFDTLDVPVLVATDTDGIVRYIGTADESALQPGQTVDSLVSVIGKRWPAPAPAVVAPQTPARTAAPQPRPNP